MADTCATCRYFILEALAVACRRYPPQPFVVPASTLQPAVVIPIWPNPAPSAWCGEFRPAETTGGVLRFPQRDAADDKS